MFGLDVYSVRARLAPAALAAAPALALGVAALPLLPGAQKLWTLVAVGVTTFASLTARAAGNRVQVSLFETWGGKPTTSRLRYRDNPSASEVTRRHHLVEKALGAGYRLPTQAEESANPAQADHEYEAAMSRIIARLRNDPNQRLLNVENRNYGYARNLLGLKTAGITLSILVLVISVLSGALVAWRQNWTSATPLVLPALTSLVALLLWPRVGPNMVRPAANAYADRVVDALDDLPSSA